MITIKFKKIWPLALSAIPLAIAPALIVTSCSQNQVETEIKAVNQKVADHFVNWVKLGFQFNKPSLTTFSKTFLPSQQDLFGFQLVNINWNFKNDDVYGLKTITYDLQRGQTIIKNQKLTFGGFLTIADEKQQSDFPALNFKTKIMTYPQVQPRQWWQPTLIEDVRLNNLFVDEVLKNHDLLKPIISDQITKQDYVVDQVKQVNYQGIDFNALQITIRLKYEKQYSKPLDFIIAGFNPRFYLHRERPAFKIFFDQVAKAINSQKISIFESVSGLTITQFLNANDDLKNRLESEKSSFIKKYIKNDWVLFNDVVTKRNWLTMRNIRINKIDHARGQIEFIGDLYYYITKYGDGNTDGFDLLTKDLTFSAFFKITT